MDTRRVKAVVVGRSAGRKALIHRFATAIFSPASPPLLGADWTRHYLTVDSHPVRLHLWNVSASERCANARPLFYRAADVVLICFSLDSPTSLENVTEEWSPEIRKHLPGVPVILVGTKKDLRSDADLIAYLILRKQIPVSEEEGEAVAERIGAKSYVECSAKTGEGVSGVFMEACRAAL